MNPETSIPANDPKATKPGARKPGPKENEAGRPADPGVLGTFALGLRVWAREMGRLAVAQARGHEARQLKARLLEERSILEKIGDAKGPDRDLCTAEISLLEAEIARLAAEERARRAVRPGRPGEPRGRA